MVFVCRLYKTFLYLTLILGTCVGFCSEHQFADVDRIMLGYKTKNARYVGRLYEVYKYPYRSSETCSPVGSVAYYKDGFCLTSAHCISDDSSWFRYFDPDWYFKIGYRVSFEIVDGQHTFFNVCTHKTHKEYGAERGYADIALLRLDREIEDFQGAKDVYDFKPLTSPLCIVGECVEAGATLTYVGYGYAGEDLDYCSKRDVYRRGCQSKLSAIFDNHLILSMPYQLNYVALPEKKWRLEPRARFQNESVVRQGMSGGITLMNDRIVGLNQGISLFYLSYKDYFASILWYCLAYFVNQTTFSSMPKLKGSCVYKGLVSMSVMLEPYKGWIEGSCVEDWRENPGWVKETRWKNNGDDMV